MINHDDVFRQLTDAGLLVDRLEVDARMHRCRVDGMDRENRGWYCLHEWRGGDGNLYIVGSYGIWQGNDQGATKVKLKGVTLSDAEKAAMRARMAEDRKRAVADRARVAEAAARQAEATWTAIGSRAPAKGECEYLERKGLTFHSALRFTASRSLVAPMHDARGTIKGLQFILPADHPRRKKTGRDKEYWPAGLQKQGHWCWIGTPVHGGVCLLCEGVATGLSLHYATGLPVAVAFDAGNLRHVAAAIKKSLGTHRILICADDDYLQKCRKCKQPTLQAEKACQHCGNDHGTENAGTREAETAVLQVGGAWVAPVFPRDRVGKKLTDFNDLHVTESLQLVGTQISDKLDVLGWRVPALRAALSPEGGGETGRMVARLSVEEAVSRYWGTYGFGGDALFDEVERRIVHKKDVLNLLSRDGWQKIKDHPAWRVALDHQVGFDPTEKDPAILCNLFGGWPTEPKAGNCTVLLSLLEYLCSNEPNRSAVYQWILRWLAYPLQHRGAKMHSAIVVHGPQGTGKSRFFEAYSKIYGNYGRVLGQEALEDKFNADWAEKKLFIVADEVLARQELYHIKNRLKGFITGDTIRVNPKNVAAHNEKNQMNIVFLSNERMPLALENDDRRHCVIWVPPKLSEKFFDDLNREIEAGGIEALHQVLLDVDLGDFKPWTRPPMTDAKEHLIELGASSEERFLKAWMAMEIEVDGLPVPFHPCLGSTLYERVYRPWCQKTGERDRRDSGLIGYLRKLPGWQAGTPLDTWDNLKDRKRRQRKMVVPPATAIAEVRHRHAHAREPRDLKLMFGPTLDQASGMTKTEWLTECFFAFESAVGGAP